MARINIESDSWPRFYKLSDLTGRPFVECIGVVVTLWHASQDIMKTHGSKSEILEWSYLFKFDDELREKYFSALKSVRFISEESEGSFCVHGNKIQIDGMVSRISKAHKAAKSMKKKWSDLKKLQETSKRPPRDLREISEAPNAMQFNAMQVNATQSNAYSSCTSVELSTKVPTGKINPREHVVFKTKEELISAFDEDTAHLWKSLYPDENYLRREFLKAWDYYVRTNPQKTPRTLSGWKRALGSWLERGWPQHMRTIQSQPKKPRAIEDILQEQGLEHVG